MATTYTYHIINRGEPAAGLPSYTEEVTISMKYGHVVPEDLPEFHKTIKEVLGEQLYDGARIYTQEEMDDIIKSEKEENYD